MTKLQAKEIFPVKKLQGTIDIPGDKSVSHRSVMFSALADTPVCIRNFLYAQDCLSTVSCMRALGAEIRQSDDGTLWVKGNGLNGLREPGDILDAGNSGTTLRLLSGILAGQPFFSALTGDASLRSRPMARVAKPLRLMGANLSGRQGGNFLPVAIQAPEKLQGIDYVMPMASAQVKSAILLATLFAEGESKVTEPYVSRDHTERMLETFGVPLKREGTSVSLSRIAKFTAPQEIIVPGDISSAAFWLVAASIIPGSELVLRNVGMNPTRTGIIDVLREMGAAIEVLEERSSGSEPVADLKVSAASLRGVEIGGEIIPRLVDEIPVLAVAALSAEGRTVIRDAGELRVKETDRLTAVATELRRLGAVLEETEDGLIIDGPQQLDWAACEAYHDHRMAMSLAVAGAAHSGCSIDNPDCVAISYPDFFAILTKVTREDA